MVPKFRCWDERVGLTEVVSIDFFRKKIKINHWEYGDSNFFPLDEVVLMQSTGLKDKNGVEIFEGDILVNQYGNVGYVAYLQQEAGFVVVKKKSDYRLGHRNTGESYDVTTNHEVIGNFWENPNLLEQANEN
ncbi:YopX family protein [Enterococcus casseliflavus]|uniref:YopX family protein n=1 Tax=Enterococcus casseliflavus TaxID=37734 RepID=UPI0039A564ED